MKIFRFLIRLLLPLVVLGGAAWGAFTILSNKPEARRSRPPKAQISVEATRLKPQTYSITIRSYGVVQPRTESTLIPQVSGKIIKVASNFREGGFFEEGQLLVTIDPRDYEAEVKIAEANLVQARLALEEERAKAAQALRDWKRLRQSGRPSDLVLRKPQMNAAQASIQAAATRLEQVKVNLERTRIRAPYAGRILSKEVDVGQFVPTGTQLAKVYAVDYAEIRLPLNSQQLELVDIPEPYRGDSRTEEGPPVMIKYRSAEQTYRWEARIVRTDGAFDVNSRQLFVVAQVDNPYGRRPEGNPPLKIGQFVEAEIAGSRLDEVIVIPRSALYQGDEVVLIEDGKIRRKAVTIIWSNSEDVVIREGVQAGDILALTPVGSLISGTQVNAIVDGEAVSQKDGGSEGAGKNKHSDKNKGEPNNQG